MRHKKPTRLENSGRAIRRTVEWLNDHDWTKGTVGTPETAVCSIGAIRYALLGKNYSTTYRFDGSRMQLVAQVETDFTAWMQKSGITESSIMGWNDYIASSKDEVIQIMTKFADEVDPQR